MTQMDAANAPARAAPRQDVARTIALLAGLAALSALSTNIILPSFPSIGAALGVTTRELGATLSSFFIAFALGQLFVGPLSDRFGRRPLVLGGLAVFAIGSVLAANAGTLGFLVFARVVQALGACAASVLSRAVARDLFEGNELARVLSFTMVAMAAAPGFSPLLGTAIDSYFGWRVAFLAVGLAGLLVAAVYQMMLGETLAPSSRVGASIAGIAGGYGALVVDRRFIMPALCVSLIIGALYAFFAATPAILLDGMGLSKLGLSLFFAATVFVVFGSGMLAPRLARRFGLARTIISGASIAGLGSVLLLAGGGAPTLAWFALSLVVFLSGMGLANPLGTAMTMQPFASHAGLASALLGFLQMTCAALATTFVTLLPFPPATALAIVLCGSSALAILAFVFRPREGAK
ncbi:MAG: multidrug effflux MFS transporter [Rhodoblastus sp.]